VLSLPVNTVRKMFALGAWALLAFCVTIVISQSSPAYQFTMSVISPAPVPGRPVTITWTGGNSTDVVYIILNYYFPDTPNQNIIYTTTDILCEFIIVDSVNFWLIYVSKCSQ